MSRHIDDTGAGHPILGFLDLLEGGLDEITAAPAWSLNGAETAEAITRLVADLARLAEVETRLLGQATTLDLAGSQGVRSLPQWLSRVTRMTSSEAGRRVRLSTMVEAHAQTREALARGEVLPEQASVIAAAIDDLDDQFAAEAERAEEFLISEAAHHDAHGLRTLGERLFATIDPDGAEAYEANLLAEQEERARKKAEVRMSNQGDGTVRGSFLLPQVQAEMFRKALQALAAPKHVRATEGAGSYDHEKPTPHKLGLAFIEYIEGYPADKLPKMGGLAATIVVTAQADIFTDGAQKPGRTETGVGISPGQLIRWACEARLMPAVLDTDGYVLDLGRAVRFQTGPQRIALIISQKVCQHRACDVPGAFCHVHHARAWKDGGDTNLKDAVLLCPFHHHRAHAQGVDYPMRT